MIAPRKSKEMANRQLIKKTTSADNISILNITISQGKNFQKSSSNDKKITIKKSVKRSSNPGSKSPNKFTSNLKNFRGKNLSFLKNNTAFKNSMRRSYNIKINQRFNIQISPERKLNSKSSLRRRLTEKSERNNKVENPKIRNEFSSNRINGGNRTQNYIKNNSKTQSRNISPISSIILRSSLREKKRREMTDRKLKVSKYFLVKRKFRIL